MADDLQVVARELVQVLEHTAGGGGDKWSWESVGRGTNTSETQITKLLQLPPTTTHTQPSTST